MSHDMRSSEGQQYPSLKRTICGIDIGNRGSRFVGSYDSDIVINSEGLLDFSQLTIFFRQKPDYLQSKLLLGLKFSDPELQYELPSFPLPITQGPNGFPLVHCTINGMDNAFTPTQFITMWLSHCRAHMGTFMSNIMSDCCIGTPLHYTYQQRKELFHAATIARLKPQRLLHETTAIALTYRFSAGAKYLLEDDKLLNMAFIDVGHSSLQVSIVELKKDQLKVLSHAHDKSLGGRGFDQLKELNEKIEANLQVENILDEMNVSVSDRLVINRAVFEKLSSVLLERIEVVLQTAMNEARLDVDYVHSVEVLGRGSSMPAIMNILRVFFRKEPMQTLKFRGAIATGCLIQCAMLSSANSVPKFQIIDIIPYSIGLSWKSRHDTRQKQLIVFPRGSPIPSVKDVILHKEKCLFSLDLVSIVANDSSNISTFLINAHDVVSEGQLVEVKVRVQVNINGFSYIEFATVGDNFISVTEISCNKFQAEHLENSTQLLKNSLETIEESSSTPVGNFTNFTYSELKEATKNFHKSFKIGEGGYGSVYKGFLRYTTVAIKMLNPQSSQGDIEFNQEVKVLTEIRHPNLVTLIGVSLEAKALIYELAPNGSLDTFLTNGKNSSRTLSWQKRVLIAFEICSALIFLHSAKPHGIVHGDLKPENVLLDSNFVSKLSDFGISRKLYKINETITPLHITENPKGTLAYVDPVYVSSGELTPQSDVFSFGIILLQFVTGGNPLGLRNLVQQSLNRGKLDEVVDSSAGNWPMKEAKKLALLGIKCSEPLRKRRPNLAKDVWPTIESMKQILM